MNGHSWIGVFHFYLFEPPKRKTAYIVMVKKTLRPIDASRFQKSIKKRMLEGQGFLQAI